MFVGLGIYGEAGAIGRALAGFRLVYLAPALLLSLANYGVRFVRWQYYLNGLGIRIPPGESLSVFLSGLTLSITPGKVGELLKSFLLRELRAVPIAVSAPIVFGERLTDLIAIILLSALGALTFQFDLRPLILASAIVVLLIGAAGSRRAANLIARQIGRWSKLQAAEQATLDASESAAKLVRPGRLVVASLLAVLAWFCECVEMRLVLVGLGWPVDVAFATFVYALATLIGALTMLPGGLVATEGSMTGLLQRFGLGKAPAAAATLIVRMCTLWFAVGLGVIVLMMLARRLGTLAQATNETGSRVTSGAHNDSVE